MNYLSNAFSLNMVSPPVLLNVEEVEVRDIDEDVISIIGHQATAEVLSALLGREVEVNRVAITLNKGDVVYVATLFDKDGRPFRPPEGRVLSVKELSELLIKIIKVEVL